MCAECHSTGVRKNYDAANDTYATRFAEISVGCEACHGQGSRHVAWARAQQSWWPFGKPQDPAKGLLRFLRRTHRHHLAARPAHRQTATADCVRRSCARRSRPAGFVMPGARPFPGTGCRVVGSPTLTLSHRSRAISILPTGRCRTRSTTTARSSRAGCSPPASPAAIATSRMPPSCVQKAIMSVCNATQRETYAAASHHHHDRR